MSFTDEWQPPKKSAKALLWVFAAAAVAAVAFGGWKAFSMRTGPAEELVRQQLRDPQSAVFQNMKRSLKDPNVVCGLVNARNGYGGMAGFTRFIAETGPYPSAELDPADDKTRRPGEGFDGKWQVYCR